jgi:hypothetical protein
VYLQKVEQEVLQGRARLVHRGQQLVVQVNHALVFKHAHLHQVLHLLTHLVYQ